MQAYIAQSHTITSLNKESVNVSRPPSPTLNNGSDAIKSRMIVLCFDGTANEFDGDNTNVVKLFAMLRKDCETEQLHYYQSGIGTYENPGILTPIALWCTRVLDEAFAWYLDAHVRGGYQFLMQNWRSGDKISIFGFSRGAYTARALAGMLTKIGLLPRDNIEQIPFAYKLYTRTDKDGLIQAKGFKQTFCREVSIDFLGVWDTVASTGVITSRTLPFTTCTASIKTFRHALSLDERRAKFVPTFFHRHAPSPEGDKYDPEHSSPGPVPTPKLAAGANAKAIKATTVKESNGKPVIGKPVVLVSSVSLNGYSSETCLLQTQKGKMNVERKRIWSIFQANVSAMEDEQPSLHQCMDVKEVWFAGCHSDVGGGADVNEVTHTLADIPLRWMVKEIIKSQCGIQFDPAAMARLNILPSLPPSPSSSKLLLNDDSDPPITAIDAKDAMQPLHDELRSQPLWWLLEMIPLPFTWQDATGVWKKEWKFHWGEGRYVNVGEPLLFHISVKARMTDKTLNYKPRAKYTPGEEKYVD